MDFILYIINIGEHVRQDSIHSVINNTENEMENLLKDSHEVKNSIFIKINNFCITEKASPNNHHRLTTEEINDMFE